MEGKCTGLGEILASPKQTRPFGCDCCEAVIWRCCTCHLDSVQAQFSCTDRNRKNLVLLGLPGATDVEAFSFLFLLLDLPLSNQVMRVGALVEALKHFRRHAGVDGFLSLSRAAFVFDSPSKMKKGSLKHRASNAAIITVRGPFNTYVLQKKCNKRSLLSDVYLQ